MGSDDSSIFWRNFVLVGAFFVLAPVVLLASMIALFSVSPVITSHVNSSQSKIGASVYVSLPSDIPSVTGKIGSGDARPEIVRQYLAYFNSPLTSYANEIVADADKYGIDFRFIPAIAQQESNLCKVIPPGSYNCWGWGITSVSSLGFSSYDDAINTVTKGLKTDYIDDGLTTPEEIMTKYTPSSNGSWAAGVREFMSEMQ